MNQIPAELFLVLQRLDVAEHLTRQDRIRIAVARARAEKDVAALEQAWRTLDRALAAESRSRTELLALTS